MIPVTDNEVDFRCASRGARKRRCQLLVGHEAGHAAMALVGNVRMIKTWSAGQLRRQVPAEDACRFPWAPGLPSVAEDLARRASPPAPVSVVIPALIPAPPVLVPALIVSANRQPTRLSTVA
jgi:hypothetical protein